MRRRTSVSGRVSRGEFDMMTDDAEAQLVELYNRAELLETRIRRLRALNVYGAPPDIVRVYNYLRADVQQWASDPDFIRSAPPELYYPSWAVNWRYVAVGLLALLVVAAPLYLAAGSTGVIVLGVAAAVIAVLSLWLKSRERPPLLRNVRERNLALRDYLHLQFHRYPRLACQVEPGKWQAQVERLEGQTDYLLGRLDDLVAENEHWRELWAGLSDPLPFDLSPHDLARLEPLEQTRLREAVQAYRVRSWTPAAAVCGMILEGRLQQLCRENGLETGGMNAMIERLHAAGLLGGHYRDLARVGEFFRHRAAHPTAEEFDRDKTTLILTSLLVLVRDVF